MICALLGTLNIEGPVEKSILFPSGEFQLGSAGL